MTAIVLLCAAMLGASFISSSRAAASPISAPVKIVADTADNCNTGGFFGLEPWYQFMPKELGVSQQTNSNGNVTVAAQPCGVRCFNIFVQNAPNACGVTQSDIPGVILAIIDDLLRVAGLVAVAFVIYGSFEFVGSRGNSERTAKAQTTVVSALTGLAIALVSVALVSFIGSTLK